jgi:hypothetical protein
MIKRDLITGLSNNKRVLRQFVSVMREDELQRRIKDYWTIYEHLDHLVLTQKMLLGRIRQFIVEEKPVMKPYTPDEAPVVEDSKKTAQNLVDEYCTLRDMQIALIRKAGRNVWRKDGAHQEYTKYSFEILLRHILLHDSFHMARMEELWIKREEYIMELNQS